MKIAILGDTHWGIRSDNRYFYDYQKQFLDNVFFPYLEEHNITKIIHLGDIVDRRKYVNYLTLYSLQEDFLKPLQNKSIEMTVICGNHDAYFKDTIAVNSLDVLLWPYSNIKRITKPTTTNNICYIPWICDDNIEDTNLELEYTDAPVVFGHLELNGYEMTPGHLCEHGHDPKMFQKFNNVFSGHFHKKSSHNNVTYLGTPWQMTWADYGSQKGFHVYDTETEEIEFIANPYELFVRYVYDDSKMSIDTFSQIDYTIFSTKYVKIVVKNRTDNYLFDLFMENVEKSEPIKVQITEDMSISSILDDEIESEGIEDTQSIINTYVERIENTGGVDKDRIKNKMAEIYNSALSYQSE